MTSDPLPPIAKDLVAICRAYGIFEREAVCCGSVSVPQCVALQALLDGALDVTRLAEELGVTNSAMTRLVDGLEGNEWVKRVRGEDDRRRVDVLLTPKGRQEARRLRGLTEAAIAAVLGRIPKAKQASVLEALSLLRQAITDTRAEVAACATSE